MAELRITSSTPEIRCGVDINVNVPDVVTYHIYSDGTIEKHIPKKITKGYEQKYKYVYHSSAEEEHEICIIEYFKIKEKYNGLRIYDIPQRTDILEDSVVNEGQTKRRILYKNGDVAEFGSNNGKTFGRLYKAKENDIEIVRMPDGINYNKTNVSISYSFSKTQRRYASPGAFAGFIGALAVTGLKVQTTGSCFRYGSCFPSSEHVNGKSIDTVYLNNADEQKFITAMNKFGFNKQVTGKDKHTFEHAIKEKRGTLHNSHLHSGFNETFVKIMTLSLLAIFLVSCSKKILALSTQKQAYTITTSPVFGDSIIAWKGFCNNVNTECSSDSGNCVLYNLRINYYQLFSKKLPHNSYKIDATHKLRFNVYKKKSSTEEHIKAYAKMYTRQIVTDSILCYEYYNNANTLYCYEQLYFIDIHLKKIYTVKITYDEDSAYADSVCTYTIVPASNKFR